MELALQGRYLVSLLSSCKDRPLSLVDHTKPAHPSTLYSPHTCGHGVFSHRIHSCSQGAEKRSVCWQELKAQPGSFEQAQP